MYDVCHGKAYDILLIPANSHLHCNSRHNTPMCRNLLWTVGASQNCFRSCIVCLSNVIIETTVLVGCDAM